jgi:hypothetical protein
MTITPYQRKQIDLVFADQCVSCKKPSNNLWNAGGFALTDDSTSDGFCNLCWTTQEAK